MSKRTLGPGMSVLLITVCWTEALLAGPINPAVFKKRFEEARKTAEVVAQVRVLAAVCTARGGEDNREISLQLALQVLKAEKGKISNGQILTVAHTVTLPAGPGPRSYGYMAAVRQFPFTPGVKGEVALRWDADRRSYAAAAGWVAQPNGASVPTEVGQAFTAGDAAPERR